MTKQELIQINSQILKLAMQQDDLNSVLGSMLSTAECLSNRYGIKKQDSYFEAYNLFGSGNRKNENDLKLQLKIQTKVFRNNYKYMLNEKGKYPFPKNFGEEKIRKIVNIWKQNSKPQNLIYYDNIINVLDKNFSINYPGEKRNTNGIEPNFILDVFPAIMNKVDQERDITRNNVIQTGVYDNNLILNGQNNMTYPEQNLPLKSKKDYENFINYINYIFHLVECFLYSNTKNTSNPIKLKYGNTKDYEKLLYMPNFCAFLNNKLNEFDIYYKECCQKKDLSDDPIISEYEDTVLNWNSNFKGYFYINKLYTIIQIRHKG